MGGADDDLSASIVSPFAAPPLAVLPPTLPPSPHFFDHVQQTLPFSPIDFLPHHDYYRVQPEPYHIATESARMYKDARVCSVGWGLAYLVFAVLIFSKGITNVDEDEEGLVYRNFVPRSWFMFLAIAMIPIVYHVLILVGFPTFSVLFTTVPKNEVFGALAQNTGAMGGPKSNANLAASSVFHSTMFSNGATTGGGGGGVSDSSAYHGFDGDSLFASTISPLDYAKKVNKRLQHLNANGGRDQPLLDSSALHSSQFIQLTADPDAKTHSPFSENWSLVPFASKKLCVGVIVLQLVGFLFRLMLTLGSIFITTILIASWHVHNPEKDFTNYSLWITAWSAFSLLGSILCAYSLLAAVGDIMSYNRHDLYHNDWLMFDQGFGGTNEHTDEFIVQQLAATEY